MLDKSLPVSTRHIVPLLVLENSDAGAANALDIVFGWFLQSFNYGIAIE
jgi:hypothetical protein